MYYLSNISSAMQDLLKLTRSAYRQKVREELGDEQIRIDVLSCVREIVSNSVVGLLIIPLNILYFVGRLLVSITGSPIELLSRQTRAHFLKRSVWKMKHHVSDGKES